MESNRFARITKFSQWPYSPFKVEVLEPMAGEGSLQQKRPWPMRETGILGTESSVHPTSGPNSLLTRLRGSAIPAPRRHAGRMELAGLCWSQRGQVSPGFTLTPPPAPPCPRLGPVLSTGDTEE